ncbi:succinylglutamate desuccinylase/aspartoacylase family protein [Paraburkholderia caribensis]|uniref:Succinylglutamate desuccinylase/aspartoacylase n=2 Tax=Paraburkholderia TaxID=1822464 RepID=B2JXT3_PARP8|nr:MULTISPECIES: succinylglutamate desuccinylase/aspartoacylase family protein [Paraburkholderia]ACC76441.1 Succinylglutamate desuccinylase/aspartoacylase [Paraburkholderia phymatum STM815]MCO4879396.1 succinylglutamate desuccinylase/aspartoacylase family protein [Paraburkholderia caribensis]PTB24562.1 succinylglutamate desuccinylase [Paraburkholderia caribensis]
MSDSTRIWSTIDFTKDGKQVDFLRLPISTDISAYGWIPVPTICLKNGDGPTAVLIAGTHGDEYEGQIGLMRLARGLHQSEVKGRVIILPSLNFPAVQAGRRVSPIDEGNLNRLYPGRAHGSATEMIAHYVTQVILPMADLVVDLHSGGRSLDYLPCALARGGKTTAENEKLLELLRVFGVPLAEFTDGTGGGGNTTLPAAAEDLGIPVITAELGGGATVRRTGSDLAEQGALRLLKHIGILASCDAPDPEPVRMMRCESTDLFVYADSGGLFEPWVDLGEEVSEGQLAGMLHSIEEPHRPPQEVLFRCSGLVVCKRHPALANRGDCLFGLLQDAAALPLGRIQC